MLPEIQTNIIVQQTEVLVMAREYYSTCRKQIITKRSASYVFNDCTILLLIVLYLYMGRTIAVWRENLCVIQITFIETGSVNQKKKVSIYLLQTCIGIIVDSPLRCLKNK